VTMNETLLGRIIERLDQDNEISEEAQYLVLAACGGDDELESVLGGSVPARPKEASAPRAEETEPPGAYLGSVTVEGPRDRPAICTAARTWCWSHPGSGPEWLREVEFR
jgi:hypothetical protein